MFPPSTALPDLAGLSRADLEKLLVELGLPPGRASRIFSLLQRPGYSNLEELPVKGEVRRILAERCRLSRLRPLESRTAKDGTVKFVFRLEDGALIETVLIPENGRHTLCLSSQVGCAMGCRFCLTGRLGFSRNLTPAEIANQVLAVLEHMIACGVRRATPRELVNNLVFMGMGEPLANYRNLLTALEILMDHRGLEFTGRRVTVSTCGIPPRMAELGRDRKVNLAVSLHAACDSVRSRLMPVNDTWNIDALLAACRAFPLPGRKVILFEYILIAGENDSEADAHLLAQKLRGIPCRVNLLPFNECGELPFRRPAAERIARFQQILRDAGYRTLVRQSRGGDIGAACGQLAGAPEPRPMPS